ncbi:MAG: acetyltransferase [Rhodospirillaceae bacterium]|nr:acetyltransferase [Rhodospirillaceae bacterium]MDD9917747.1 acetyltransferase [Rhodospirillaceae bacterium]
MNSDKPIVIVGAGGHGKVLLDICRTSGGRVAGFLDADSALPPQLHGVPILGSDELLGDRSFVAAHAFVLGVGETAIRSRLSVHLEQANAALATLVHPSAAVSELASIGSGTTVHAGAIVNIDAKIGTHCVVNTGASVDHDCTLSDGVQVGPGATLAGGVTCQQNVFVGTGASILPNVTIGRDAIVGGGSSVAKDVPEGVTVYGVPARIVRPAE